jgi:quinol monooxygenase YgiN
MLCYQQFASSTTETGRKAQANHMETVVATLAYTVENHDREVLTHLRFIIETLRQAPGFLTSRLYSSRGNSAYYLALTTWNEKESWLQSQETHNPQKLLIQAARRLLTMPPKQWPMHYLWGYHRPTAQPTLAAAHIVTIPAFQTTTYQKGWLRWLSQQSFKPNLSFALLARSIEEKKADGTSSFENSMASNTTFLNLLSWSNQAEQDAFYADINYQAFDSFLRSTGVVHLLPLEPIS